MDFFQRQDKARSNTAWLAFLFAAGLISTALLIHCLVSFCVSVYGGVSHENSSGINFIAKLLDPDLFVFDFLSVAGFILIVSFLRTASLKKTGPDGIALSLGGRLVKRGSGSPRDRRLYNVVEEIALAAGCPVPRVYIMRNEPSINACAIGTSPENAAVCVTAGSMDYLTRDELQGVVAHEFSHIVNNDVDVNTKIIGYLFGLELIALIAALVFRSVLQISPHVQTSRSNSKNGGAELAIILGVLFFSGVLFLIGYVGTVFGNIIRAAISRQREYLADASAVQFTRNPNGIVGALKKIGCPNLGSQISNSASVQASHLFFGSVFKTGFLQSVFQTHPPLARRIRAIDPSFDGVFPISVEKNDWARSSSEESEVPCVANSVHLVETDVESASFSQFAGNAVQNESVVPGTDTITASSCAKPTALGFTREQLYGSAFENAVKSPDVPNKGEVRIESSVLQSVPSIWERFLVDSLAARATLYAILRGRSIEEIQAQQEIIEQSESFELKGKLNFAWKAVKPLGDASRLILARKAIPLLKTMGLEEYQHFRETTIKLCQADGVLDLFEYTLQALVIRELDLFYRLSREPKIRYSTLESVLQPFALVLSYLAYEGALRSGDEVGAFKSGASEIGASVSLVPRNECALNAFSRALNALSVSAPLVKQKVIRALYKCVAYDGTVVEKEAATISAVTAALGVPSPVWRDWK